MTYVDWDRYWYRRDATPLLDRGVFLWAQTVGGERVNPQVLPLEGCGDIPVLVLLGEPGIGKTDAVAQRVRLHREVHVINLPDEVSLDLLEARLKPALDDLDKASPQEKCSLTASTRRWCATPTPISGSALSSGRSHRPAAAGYAFE